MDPSVLLDWNFLLQAIDLDGSPWQRPAVAFLVLVFFLVLRRALTHWMLWLLLGGLSRLLRLERSRIDGILRDPATLVPIAAGIYFAARILQSGVEPTLVSPAAKFVMQGPSERSCRGQHGRRGSRGSRSTASRPRSRVASWLAASAGAPRPSARTATRLCSIA